MDCWWIVAAVLVALWPRDASADEELDEVEEALQAQYDSLATADCAVACKALESMIRSADRICELEPGPRCTEARRKVSDAKRRVREACPECSAAAEEKTVVPKPPVTAPALGTEEIERRASPASAPPPASDKRGCAACALGSSRDGMRGWLLVFGALMAWLRRRART